MKIQVLNDYSEISRAGAEIIAETVKKNPRAVLGLATGATPEGVYDVLAEKYDAGELDFSEVTTVNLDEYSPIEPSDEQSYRYFMEKHLFSRVNIRPENTNVPIGNTADPTAEAKRYEAKLASLGYADLQLLGVGQNGHIGFNEPAAALCAETHLTPLSESTLAANSIYFTDRPMPTEALTMGMASILRAKKILLLASGKSKHAAIARLLAGEISTECPITFLLLHPDCTVICDRAAYEG